MTKTERIIRMLLAQGSIEMPSPSSKYRKFTRTATYESYYWVGMAGALRVGRTSSHTLSMGRPTVSKLLAEFEAGK